MARRKKQLTPQFATGTIKSLSHDGRGILSSAANKTVFVAGALPHEEVHYKIFKNHARYDEAETVEIISPSHHRIQAECQYFGVCGGCSLQHLTMQAQLDYKQKTLLEQLQHFGKVTPLSVLAPLSGKSFHYRGKARIGVSFRLNQNKLVMGFRERSSRFLADLESCSILDEAVSTEFTSLKEMLRTLSIQEHIPQIEVAVGDRAKALIVRHLKAFSPDDITTLKAYGKAHDFHLYLQPNAPDTLQKIWPEDNDFRLSYDLPNHALTLQFHPLDFTQVNQEMNQKMIDTALDFLNLQTSDTVLDLFCGLGNFTLPIARYAKAVIGVEGSEMMVERGYENAALNNIENSQFFAANLFEEKHPGAAWMKQKYDKILLDPPRTGAKEIIALFPKLGAKHIVYVSCNPATLARDAGILVNQQGFQLQKIQLINMFPHTSHVESIALFTKP